MDGLFIKICDSVCSYKPLPFPNCIDKLFRTPQDSTVCDFRRGGLFKRFGHQSTFVKHVLLVEGRLNFTSLSHLSVLGGPRITQHAASMFSTVLHIFELRGCISSWLAIWLLGQARKTNRFGLLGQTGIRIHACILAYTVSPVLKRIEQSISQLNNYLIN